MIDIDAIRQHQRNFKSECDEAEQAGPIPHCLRHAWSMYHAIDRLIDTFTAVRDGLSKIVIDEGTDSGVILLSDASPTYYDTAAKCQVYEHEHFSELGDALVALAWLVKEPTDE